MIVIKENIYIRDSMFRRHTKKTIRCHLCENDIIFFDMSPIMCYFCNTSLPNSNRIYRDVNYRADYHTGRWRQ